MARRKASLMNYAYPAFGAGLGIMASFVLYLLVAVIFFVSGFVLLKKEKAKTKEQQSDVTKGIAFVLMGIGMIVGLGFGGGIFFSELGAEF